MIEIKKHDGPARLGKYSEMETPAIVGKEQFFKYPKR